MPEEVRAGYGLGRDEISSLAAAEPAGCDGVSFVPFLAGERTPNWPHASGAMVGLRAGHLARRYSRDTAEMQPRDSRETAERQPRYIRDAAEMQPRYSRDAA